MKTLLWLLLLTSCGAEGDGRSTDGGDAMLSDVGVKDEGSDGFADATSCEQKGPIRFDIFFWGCEEESDLLTQTVLMWNIGEEPVQILDIFMRTEIPPPQFGATPCRDPPFEISACESCELTVTWKPRDEEPGITSETLVIVAEAKPELNFSLCGVNRGCPWKQGKCE